MINIKSYASGSKGNLYLVSNKDTNIILECGVDKNLIYKIQNIQNTDKLKGVREYVF